MTHTTETIKTLLTTSNAAVEKALIVLYERQTSDEQATGTTRNVNGRGFSAFDAEILSSFACQVEKKIGQGRKLGQCLSEKQMELARKKVTRYAKQLAEVANAKCNVESAVVAPTIEESPTFTYWLRRPKQDWLQLSREEALLWHSKLAKMAQFYRSGVKMEALDEVKESRFWINYSGELLQLVKDGESLDPADWQGVAGDAMIGAAKKFEAEPEEIIIERAEALGLDLEREMWEMEARGDREGTLRDEKAKAEWKASVEGRWVAVSEPLSEPVYGSDPKSKYGKIKAQIASWATS